MALAQEKDDWNFADYLEWDGEGRVEIMDGKLIMMAPPLRIHQEVSGNLARLIGNFLEGKRCKVYAAPFAVRLFAGEHDRPEDVATVFEPDICVICDHSKLDRHGCHGAPELIVEILLPSSIRHDMLFKMSRYQRAGVQEYWIVEPANCSVQVYLNQGGRFQLCEIYTAQDIAKVHVLDGCFIDLSRVFPEEE